MTTPVLFDSEAVRAALFARVAAASWAALGPDAIATWVLSTRKLSHWNDVSRESMPYLGMRQDVERIVRERGMPPKWLLRDELYVYVNTLAGQDAAVIPATQLNRIKDAVIGILEPNAYAAQKDDVERTTLGGLVDWCRVADPVEDFEGLLGDLGVMIIPVETMVPT